MFIEERHRNILDILNRDGKIFVKNLSLEFKVSESMIRKDLKVLEKNNLLKRTYGGAIAVKRPLVTGESFFERIEKNTDIKKVIANKAYALIKENDTIFLDASSISYMLAQIIFGSNKNVTLITNMMEIAPIIPVDSHTHAIFIGGDYNVLVGGNTGSTSINQINLYRCNKCFIGCSGIDISDGCISSSDSEDAATKKSIMKISRESFLLAPNERFNLDGTFNFSNLSDFNGIITESIPNNSITALLKEYDINLI